MNNHFYLHYEKDKKSLIRAYFWALIPIILFSFYKNGILLYQNGYISFLDMFLPFYFYLISVLVGYLVAVIKKENHLEFMLYSLIIACTISINTNMIIYPILLFVSLFIMSYLARKKNFNFIAGSRILLVLALLLQQYSYLNLLSDSRLRHKHRQTPAQTYSLRRRTINPPIPFSVINT